MTRKTALPSVAALALLLLVLVFRWRSPAEEPAPRTADRPVDEGPVSTAARNGPVEAAAPLRAGVATLRVAVLDHERKPLGGAAVRALETRSIGELGRCSTDAAGSCSISRLPAGNVRAYVHTGKHRPKYSDTLSLSGGETREVELQLELGRAISGRVLSDEGTPVAGAKVGSSDEGSALSVTDEAGRFELGGLGAEPVNLFATADGYAPRQIRGVRPGAAGFDLTLERPAALSGRVSFGKASSFVVSVCHLDAHFGREICIARQQIEPARSEYTLGELPSGSYDVVIEAPGHHTERARILLRAGETASVPELTLRVAP